MQWPVKDGVQGVIQSSAGKCAEYIRQKYLLRHVATVKAVERAGVERQRKAAEENRRKLGDAY